jgi:hypothetical protein
MLYALLCYNDEDVVYSWTREQDAAVMAKIDVVRGKLIEQGKLGPSLRLLPTTAATTFRKSGGEPLVLDGPFAETKEQLLGFYIIDVADLDEALAITAEISAANPGSSYEIRPVGLYHGDERQAARAESAGA